MTFFDPYSPTSRTSEMADVKIVQVVVEVDGELCAVFLPPVHTETLVPMIAHSSKSPR